MILTNSPWVFPWPVAGRLNFQSDSMEPTGGALAGAGAAGAAGSSAGRAAGGSKKAARDYLGKASAINDGLYQ